MPIVRASASYEYVLRCNFASRCFLLLFVGPEKGRVDGNVPRVRTCGFLVWPCWSYGVFT